MLKGIAAPRRLPDTWKKYLTLATALPQEYHRSLREE